MANSDSHQALLYNILMTPPMEEKHVQKDDIDYTYHDNNTLFAVSEESISTDFAKELLGKDYLSEGENYRLVTTLYGMSVVCDVKGREQIFFLTPEQVATYEPAPEMEYSTFKEDKKDKVFSWIFRIGIGFTVAIVLFLIFLLTWR